MVVRLPARWVWGGVDFGRWVNPRLVSGDGRLALPALALASWEICELLTPFYKGREKLSFS